MPSTADDINEIRHLLHHYCFHMDALGFTELGDLFAADGEWITPYAHVKGPAAVCAVMTRNVPPSPKRVHLTMNSIISVDGDRATATSNYLTLLDSPTGPMPSVVGIYDDILVRTPAGWHFQRRQLIHMFKGDMGLRI